MAQVILARGVRVEALLPNSTLAVLWDNDAALELGSDLQIKGGLHWRYATRYIIVTNEGIKTSADDDNQAQELTELTEKANSLLSSGRLEAAYPPLARVQQYADVAGLLRWAAANESTVAVDFSELSQTASYDPKRTQTPDRIMREDASRNSPPCRQ